MVVGWRNVSKCKWLSILSAVVMNAFVSPLSLRNRILGA